MSTEHEKATSRAEHDTGVRAAVGVLRGELDLGVVFLSDAAADILGVAHERGLGHGWLESLDPRDRERASDALAAVAAGGGSRDVDCRVIGNGPERTIRIVAVPVRSDTGAMGYLASLEDVTDRRGVERDALHFRRLTESAPIGVTLTARDGTVTYANPRMLEIIGRSAGDYIGQDSTVCLHAGDRERVRVAAMEAIEARTELRERVRFVRPSGEVRWIDIRSAFVLARDGQVEGSVASVIDVSDDVAARRDAERLALALETTPDFVTFHDPEGRAFYLNRAAREFWHVDDDAPLPSLTPDKFLNVGQTAYADMVDVLQRDGLWSGEIQVLSQEGERVTALTAIVAHRDADGDIEYYSALSRNISELRAVETRYRSLLLHAPDLILVLAPGGAVKFASPAAKSVLGLDPSELEGSPITDHVAAQELQRLRASLAGIADSPGQVFPFEVQLLRKDGRARIVEGTVVSLLDDAAVEGIVINARDVTDRRLAEVARRRSEAALRAIVQSSPLAIFALDRNGVVHLWNNACEELFGWSSDDVIGNTLPFAAHDDRFFDDVRTRVFSGETVIGAPTEQQRKDGSTVALSVSIAPLREAGGRVLTAVAVAADVSEQRRAEEALRANEERMRLLIAGVSDVISIIDRDGTLRYVSSAAERMFGYTREPLGQNVLDVVHPEDRERVFAAWGERPEPGEPFTPVQLRARRADGSYVDIEVVANDLTNDPAISGIVMTTRDISERKAAEARLEESQAQLRESEARYRAVVDDQTELVCRYRADTTLTFVNRAFAEFYGRSTEDCIGVRLLDLYPAIERQRELQRLDSFGPEKQVETLEDWEVDAAGMLHWYQWTDRAFLDAAGEVVEFQSVGRDATERRRAAMLTAQQAEILEEVARGVPLDQTLASIARVFEQHFPGHMGVVWLYDAERHSLRLGTTPNFAFDFDRVYDSDPGTGPAVEAIARRETVVVADIAVAPPSAWHDAIAAHDMRSCWATPIFASDGERVLGVVDVYSRQAGEPSHDHQQIASLVTHLAAIAIERKEFEDRLAHHSLHDPLTQLPNRTLFLDRLAQAIARCRRTHARVAVLFFDLDRFKVVNDSLGHDAGDELLVAMARRLEAVIRPGDTVARFGGDEFTVLCEDLSGDNVRQDAVEIAERLAAAINAPFVLQNNETFLSASIGIALASTGEERPEELLRDADAAMYHAKELGRGRVEVFDDQLRARALARHATETALHQALQRGEFCLFFQPIVSLAEGRCVGAEALVRWKHPTRGLIAPSEFIPLAEETGLVVDLGAWVLEEAARHCATWQLDSDEPFTVSVNLSARQLAQADLVDRVGAALRTSGASPANICLEITESVLMDDAEATMGTIEQLRALGVCLSIDDFGTGYSSLGYLKRFPVEIVKIDRSFVDGLGTDAGDTAIVSAVIGLAHALGMRAVAEGVESAEQLSELVALGCDEAQGYFFAPPQPGDDLRELLGRNRRWRPPGARIMTAPRPPR